jgi:2'-5' RNA ligase
MSLLIVSYPKLDAADQANIQGLRTGHDPNASIIAAHFTLVFAFDGLDAAAGAHVRNVARRSAPILFQLTSAAAVKAPLAAYGHVFLVPDEGRSAIQRLHDALYEGPLAGELASDIPFIPHLTVGRFGDHARARALARRINRRGLGATGVLGAIDLIGFDGRAVTPVRTFALAGALDGRALQA